MGVLPAQGADLDAVRSARNPTSVAPATQRPCHPLPLFCHCPPTARRPSAQPLLHEVLHAGVVGDQGLGAGVLCASRPCGLETGKWLWARTCAHGAPPPTRAHTPSSPTRALLSLTSSTWIPDCTLPRHTPAEVPRGCVSTLTSSITHCTGPSPARRLPCPPPPFGGPPWGWGLRERRPPSAPTCPSSGHHSLPRTPRPPSPAWAPAPSKPTARSQPPPALTPSLEAPSLVLLSTDLGIPSAVSTASSHASPLCHRPPSPGAAMFPLPLQPRKDGSRMQSSPHPRAGGWATRLAEIPKGCGSAGPFAWGAPGRPGGWGRGVGRRHGGLVRSRTRCLLQGLVWFSVSSVPSFTHSWGH